MKKYAILFLVFLTPNLWAQVIGRATYPNLNPNTTAEEVARYNSCVDGLEAELVKQSGGNPGKIPLSGPLGKMVETRCGSILRENQQKIINEQASKLNKDARETIRKEQEAYNKQQSNINNDIQEQINAINRQNQKEADASPKMFIGKREIVGGGPTGLMYKDNKAPVQPQDLSKMVEK